MPVEHVASYYAASANPAPSRPPLTADVEADVDAHPDLDSDSARLGHMTSAIIDQLAGYIAAHAFNTCTMNGPTPQ
mgnify:CR=1 FL=1